MTFEMSRLRKEDLSLYYYIKDCVLCCFVEREEMVPLNCMAEISSPSSVVYEAVTTMLPPPNERGRGWIYFDTASGIATSEAEDDCSGYKSACDSTCFTTVTGTRADGVPCNGTPEQSDRVVVYDANYNVVSSDDYIIDYIDGRIVTSSAVDPKYVDYDWHYVSVVDEWSVVEASEPPVIVVDISETKNMGYQLGGGRKIIRKVDIHVFASNPAERNDIVETLYNGLYLKSTSLYNFPTGTALDYDGTFFGRRDNSNKLTSLFSRETVSGSSMLQFEEVVARHVNLPLVMTRTRDEVMLSDLNAYRSKVSFNLVSYTGS